MNEKGTMPTNSALRRAKRTKQSEVLMYIDPFFRSSHVFPLQKCDDVACIADSPCRDHNGISSYKYIPFNQRVLLMICILCCQRKNPNCESKRGNPISSKEKCLEIANICSTFHLEYS